jgi:serine/threonine protein kinase
MSPDINYIISAAQDQRFIKDPFLKEAELQYNSSGRPKMFGGGFSQVFVMKKDQEDWAFKVWHRLIDNNKIRYIHIKNQLAKASLPYFVDFEYVENGLLVDGDFLDTLRMRWIDASSLVEFISGNLYRKDVLLKLAANFKKMTHDLHVNSISHGDLQTGNIFIQPNAEIILIDYDSICVPETEGELDICRGTGGYQHPSRLSSGYYSSTKVDFFSELIIYMSILAVTENPLLWDKHGVPQSESRLLFMPEDFLAFRESPIRRDLLLLSDKIKQLVYILDDYLASHLKITAFDISTNEGRWSKNFDKYINNLSAFLIRVQSFFKKQ